MKIVALPEGTPTKWDLADPDPPGLDAHALLESAGPLQSNLRRFIQSVSDFVKEKLPQREFGVEPFLEVPSISMVYAARGVGKTWFALSMALAISKGEDFLGFTVPVSRTVLLIDGEMALAELQSRLRQLGAGSSQRLFLLPSERLFREDRPLNINSPEDQKRIEDAVEDLRAEGRGPEVVVLDNLSSLSGGIDENDNSALDAFLHWLIKLRHKGLAIVLVHHSGKSGDQRGASRREDFLDTCIKLSKPKPEKGDEDLPPPPAAGANFMVEFTKTRGVTPDPSLFGISLLTGPDDQLEWSFVHNEAATARDKTLREIALSRPQSQTELVDKRRLSKGSISQHCKQLRERDLLRRGTLEITTKGYAHLIDLWPDLDGKISAQNDIPI